MIIGYARVSTADQSLDMQVSAIEKHAIEQGEEFKLFQEKESGGKAERKELQQALDMLRSGDKFVVYKLDRLARSTKQLYELSELLEKKGVEFVSLKDKIDTTTAAGRAMFGMMSVFAEFERSLIQERTKAGLEAARRRGKVGGRPTLDPKTKKRIKTLFDAGESASDIAKEYSIGRSTVYKVLKEAEEAKSR